MRILFLLATAAAIASGQTGPEILKEVAETYQSLKAYQFEAQVVTESVSESNESRSRTTRISAAILPDRRRLESKGGPMASLRVHDGQTVWDFRPGPNQFARQDQATYKPPRDCFAMPSRPARRSVFETQHEDALELPADRVNVRHFIAVRLRIIGGSRGLCDFGPGLLGSHGYTMRPCRTLH